MSYDFEFAGERPDLREGDIVRTDDDIAVGDIAVFERINPGLVAVRSLAIQNVAAYRGKAYLVVPSEDASSPLLVQLHQPGTGSSDPVTVTQKAGLASFPRIFTGRVTWMRLPADVFAGIGENVPWYYTDQAKAIWRSDGELVFEIRFQKASYVVYLTRQPDMSFSGYSVKTEDGKDLQGKAAGRLFQGSAGCFFYGRWTEPNTAASDIWWIDLLPEV